jgi:DNA polymerase III subunit delta'
MSELYPWQQEIWQRLSGLKTRLPHALLLKGAQGIGKLDLAMNLAQSVLCELPQDNGMACGTCPSCHWFLQESHPDFRLLQPAALAATEQMGNESGKKPARQITVDQVRALADFCNLSSYRGGYRVVLICPAETMNHNAANALLKTLEEPQGKMLFILVTHKPQHLLPTILSRSHSIPVAMPTQQASLEWLQQQGVGKPQAVLAQAGFAPLLARQLAEEMDASEEYDLVLEAMREPGQMDEFALAERLKSKRIEPVKVVQWLQQWCYDLISSKLSNKIRYNHEYTDYIDKLSKNIEVFELLQLHRDLAVAKREAFHPLEPRLLFESLFAAYRQVLRGNARKNA